MPGELDFLSKLHVPRIYAINPIHLSMSLSMSLREGRCYPQAACNKLLATGLLGDPSAYVGLHFLRID